MYEDASIEARSVPAGRPGLLHRLCGVHRVQAGAPPRGRGRATSIPRSSPTRSGASPESPMIRGTAERVMCFGRRLLPLAGWRPSRLRAFLDLERAPEQAAYWRAISTPGASVRPSTPSCRGRCSAPSTPRLSSPVCRHASAASCARAWRAASPCIRTGRTRTRARCCSASSATSPRPRRQGGSVSSTPKRPRTSRPQPKGASTASRSRTSSTAPENAYRARLFAAVKRAAAPGAVVVLRSFGEPPADLPTNRAPQDRAMLWGIVDVKPVALL